MELPEKDRPSEEIWLDSEAIADHFAMVRERYRSDKDDDWEDIPDARDFGYSEEARRLRERASRRR
jgi:hypothetical protein